MESMIFDNKYDFDLLNVHADFNKFQKSGESLKDFINGLSNDKFAAKRITIGGFSFDEGLFRQMMRYVFIREKEIRNRQQILEIETRISETHEHLIAEAMRYNKLDSSYYNELRDLVAFEREHWVDSSEKEASRLRRKAREAVSKST